jgi:phosphoribosylglycinamide formyltransferase-1
MKSVLVLISGRGSNLVALLDAGLPCRFAAVLSDRPQAAGLEAARRRGVAAEVVDFAAYPVRDRFDEALAAAIERHAPDLVVMAGFMRVLGDALIRRWSGRLLNIHPSLLPAFPGLHTHRRALEAGVRVHGCTVHFVTPELDAGPIVAQAAVPVLHGDDERRLAARVLSQEHRIYPAAVRWWLEGRLDLGADGRVRVAGATAPDASLIVPEPDPFAAGCAA